MATILIVEDDPRLELTYKTLFGQKGLKVNWAYNGEEAMAAITEPPEIIILDITMPKMNGLEFLKQFKKKYPDSKTKVIIFSNMATPDNMAQAYDLGAVKYLVKSQTTPKQLLEEVEKTITSN